MLRAGTMTILLAISTISTARADEALPDDTRPLSPAQLALFETPHLRNVDHAETLDYGFIRDGGAGFTDKVALHVRRVNPDGTKDLSFDYLTGDHHVQFPELDHFRGNPLLMLTLERDVDEMRDAVGLSASYFRNKIREAFVTGATLTDATFILGGVSMPAREITVHPFKGDPRLGRIQSLQDKSYSFILADGVPGTVAEIRIAVPADAAMAAPAFSQRTIFVGVEP
jgi:hypothetical protein